MFIQFQAVSRNFGVTSRKAVGGDQPSGSHYGAGGTRADSNSSGFSPDYRDLGRGPFIQWLIDFATLVFAIVFVCALASSLPLAIFLMMFASF
jgi:hypothetical protein